MEVIAEALDIDTQAVYLDEKGNGGMSLVRVSGIERSALPAVIRSGSAFAAWLRGGSGPESIEGFFGSAGELTESEMRMQDAFAEAGLGSVCPLRFGGETIGFYLFSTAGCGECPPGKVHEAVRLMASLAAASMAAGLITDETGRGAVDRERALELEFRAVRNAVLERTAAELDTALGVLKSGLWSIGEGEDSVILEMARDAAVHLEARVRELVSLGGIERGDSDLALVEVDVAEVVEDVTREMIADFERRELVLDTRNLAEGRTIRADRGRMEYVIRSMVEEIAPAAPRGARVEITISTAGEGPSGEDGPWLVVRVSGGGTLERDDALEAVLDSIAAGRGGTTGPPPDSGLTLSGYILQSHGGILVPPGDDPGAVTAYLPLGY